MRAKTLIVLAAAAALAGAAAIYVNASKDTAPVDRMAGELVFPNLAPRAAAIAKLGRPLAGLALRPKPGTADRDLKDAVVWYDAETLAPVAVEATRAGGRTTVVLRNATVNGGLDDAQRALLTIAAGGTEGWRVDERPLPPEAPR